MAGNCSLALQCIFHTALPTSDIMISSVKTGGKARSKAVLVTHRTPVPGGLLALTTMPSKWAPYYWLHCSSISLRDPRADRQCHPGDKKIWINSTTST